MVLNTARDYLGDERGSVFKTPYLLRWARRAYDEMADVFKNYQLPEALVVAPTFVVTAGTASIDPSVTTELTGFGDPRLFEERASGSTDRFTPVLLRDILPQVDPSAGQDKFYYYTFHQGKFQMNAANQNIEARFTFYASGAAESLDETVTIAVDDCLNFLAAATAAKAAPGKGYTQEAARAATDAYGANNPNPLANPGGYLQALVDSKLRILQQSPVIPPMYRAGQFRR